MSKQQRNKYNQRTHQRTHQRSVGSIGKQPACIHHSERDVERIIKEESQPDKVRKFREVGMFESDRTLSAHEVRNLTHTFPYGHNSKEVDTSIRKVPYNGIECIEE